jgi:putative transposase
MGKPPALPGDAQSLTVPGTCESLPAVNRSRRGVTDREAFNGRRTEFKPYGVDLQVSRRMDTEVSHKGGLRRTAKAFGAVFRELAPRKGSLVVAGYLMPGHVHMLVSIRPNYAVAQVVGFIKGKSAIRIARTFLGRRRNFTGHNFWARGHFVSTLRADEEAIRAYIKRQEKQDRRLEQLEIFE